MTLSRRLLTASVILLLAAGNAGAKDGGKDGDRDEDDLYKARKRGDVLPLETILEKISNRIGRDIIEIESGREDGRYVYEIYYLDAGGKRREVYVDAATGEIIKDRTDD